MKKIIKTSLIMILCLLLAGCNAGEFINKVYMGLTSEQRPHIAFSRGTLFEDSKEKFFEASEFENRTFNSSQYRVDMFYSNLTEEERIVYSAFEYAMEEGYTNILIDDLLVPNIDSLGKILRFFSLDSPLMEQNLRFESGDFTTYYENEIMGNTAFDGFYITVHNFTEELWNKKLAAIKKAEEIVAEIPQSLTAAEKAEYLYRIVAQADYVEYVNTLGTVSPYLYDALITGKTHCDGYTNAISLLFNMAGIECVEKNYTAENEEVGHTWNAFLIDGKWYNCDGAGGSMIPKRECSMKAGYFFGFSDTLQEYAPDYEELYPTSEEGLYMQIDARIPSADNNFFNSVIGGYRKHNNEWALVILDNGNEDMITAQMEKIANHLNSSVYYYVYDLNQGHIAVLVCSPELCE